MHFLFSIACLALLSSCITNSTLRIDPSQSPELNQKRMDRDLSELTGMEVDSIRSKFTIRKVVNNRILKRSNYKEVADLYDKIKKKKHPKSPLPLLELKNSNRAILFGRSDGLWGPVWALVEFDRTTFVITNIHIHHKGETPGLGAEISQEQFENQFVGHKLTSLKNSFGLKSHSSSIQSREEVIDGISGATTSSKAAVQAVNSVVHLYRSYIFN